MKRFIVMAVLLLMALGASAQEGKNIYNRYSGGEGVSAVYISPSMFKLIGKLPDLEVEEGVDLAPLIRTFEGFYMLDISDASAIVSLRKDVGAMVSKGRYELMMEVKDEGDNMNIYTAGDDKVIKSFIFVNTDGDSMQFICIDGAMNRSDVEKLIVEASR